MQTNDKDLSLLEAWKAEIERCRAELREAFQRDVDREFKKRREGRTD